MVATSRSIPASDDPQVHTVRGDLADPDTAARVVDAALERFGRIDTLVNNAGLFLAKPFTAYTDDDFAAMIGLNLAGFFATTRRAVVPMLEQGAGHVLTITTSLVDHALSAVPVGPRFADQGGIGRRDKMARHRVRGHGRAGERGVPGDHQDPDAPRRGARRLRHAARWAAWARSRRSCTPLCTSRPRPS